MNPERFKTFFPGEFQSFFSDAKVDFILSAEAHGFSVYQKNALWTTYQVMPEKVFTMRQVHGHRVLTITLDDIPQTGEIPDADAMITNVPGVFLSMRTADCLPVFLCDPKKKCIGLVHAGWKGSAQKIVEKAVAALVKTYGSQPRDILAAFGPAIRECCYDVGQEFQETFPDEVKLRHGQLCFDNPLANKNQLLSVGVKEENILDSGICTVCGAGYFSFRRDKEKSGRHLSLMALLDKRVADE